MKDDTLLHLEIVSVFIFKFENYFNIKRHVLSNCCKNVCDIFMGINPVHICVLPFDT